MGTDSIRVERLAISANAKRTEDTSRFCNFPHIYVNSQPSNFSLSMIFKVPDVPRNRAVDEFLDGDSLRALGRDVLPFIARLMGPRYRSARMNDRVSYKDLIDMTLGVCGREGIKYHDITKLLSAICTKSDLAQVYLIESVDWGNLRVSHFSLALTNIVSPELFRRYPNPEHWLGILDVATPVDICYSQSLCVKICRHAGIPSAVLLDRIVNMADELASLCLRALVRRSLSVCLSDEFRAVLTERVMLADVSCEMCALLTEVFSVWVAFWGQDRLAERIPRCFGVLNLLHPQPLIDLLMDGFDGQAVYTCAVLMQWFSPDAFLRLLPVDIFEILYDEYHCPDDLPLLRFCEALLKTRGVEESRRLPDEFLIGLLKPQAQCAEAAFDVLRCCAALGDDRGAEFLAQWNVDGCQWDMCSAIGPDSVFELDILSHAVLTRPKVDPLTEDPLHVGLTFFEDWYDRFSSEFRSLPE